MLPLAWNAFTTLSPDGVQFQGAQARPVAPVAVQVDPAVRHDGQAAAPSVRVPNSSFLRANENRNRSIISVWLL